MLVDLPDGWDIETNPFMLALRGVGLGARPTERYARGHYITHLNFNHDIKHLVRTECPFMRDWRDGAPSDFGVCDSPEQILLRWPELEQDVRKFLIYMTRIDKDSSNAGEGGGWRWHKWGEYIGVHEPQFEYLDDEGPEITHVYVFNIVEMR